MSGMAGAFVVLGVTGSIAAYKSVELARRLSQQGATVQVVMTRSATEFVQPLTFQALTHRPVELDVFGPQDEKAAAHVAMGQQADVVVIAPATAHAIAKLALGLADDVIGTTVLASSAPLVVAPAMETHMWGNAATAANVAALRARGAVVVEPEEGELASGAVGTGRLASIERLLAAVAESLGSSRALTGRRVVVTAGPTVEPIDPVRVLSNRSSGKMGYAIAAAAVRAGADVTLISGPTALAAPQGVTLVSIETAGQLAAAVQQALPTADAIVMAAAVADYRVAEPSATKIKKEQDAVLTLRLVRTPDVLKAVVAQKRPTAVIVGFKAETGDPVPAARRMLHDKGVDLVVANDVSAPGSEFGSDTNRVTFVGSGGDEALPLMTKQDVARRLVAWLAGKLA